MPQVSENDEKVLRNRRRSAAKKAWNTIRKRKREKATELMMPLPNIETKNPDFAKFRTDYGKGIVHLFEKTPSDIACGPFWELRWGFGCPFNCAYCYLRGTLRGRMRPRYINITDVLATLEEVFHDGSFNGGKAAVFNSGELADSWMNPQYMIRIVDRFEEQTKHKILTLTKFGHSNPMVKLLLGRVRKQTIPAFSINADNVARRYESDSPSPAERIKAASMLSALGYEIRIRIDPIFPVNNWDQYYEDLLYSIFSELEPNRIILGTPRGLGKTLKFARESNLDASWISFLERRETGWGWKLPFDQRKSIYDFFYDKLRSIGYDTRKVSICKETVEMWKAMAFDYSPHTCCCYWI